MQRPFTFAKGLSIGLRRADLESEKSSRLLHGVYILASVPVDAQVHAQAALLGAHAKAFASHHTAARLWGGIVPDTPQLHVSVAPGVRRSSRAQLVAHRSARTPTTFHGIRVTSALDTFLDCARSLDLVDLVILGDSLVKKGRFTPERLRAHCAAATGRGVGHARAAAELVRSGVDSPMETRARLLRVLSGLPELETDIRFYDQEGKLLWRLDAGDRATRTGVEYDGRHHINRVENWEADIGRREQFENDGWRIVSLVSRDVFVTPGETVERLRQIFVQRGLEVGPPSDEWKRHFPGRPVAC